MDEYNLIKEAETSGGESLLGKRSRERTQVGAINNIIIHTGVYILHKIHFFPCYKIFYLFLYYLQDEENYTESSKKKKYDRAHAYDKASLDRIQKAPEKKVLFVKIFKYFSRVDYPFLGAKKLYNSHCMSVRNDIV